MLNCTFTFLFDSSFKQTNEYEKMLTMSFKCKIDKTSVLQLLKLHNGLGRLTPDFSLRF